MKRGAAGLVLALAVAGCFSERPDGVTGPGSDEVVVAMTDVLTFDPATVTVRTGQTVVWRSGRVLHTVTADAARARDPSHVRLPTGADGFDSGSVAAGQAYRRTFTVAGTYDYFCVPHELQGMLGRLVVTD